MIAKLLFFVLKSSFLIVNATLICVVLIGCAGGKKSKNDTNSPPPTANQDDVTTKKELRINQNSSASTEKEPTKQPTSASSSTPSQPPSQPVSKPKTPDNRTPDNRTPDKKGKSEMKLDKTQRMASKESLRPPPRTIRNGPPVKKTTSREAQKTMRDVKEFSAREAPILGEKSTNQQDFDDYLNNLGENKN